MPHLNSYGIDSNYDVWLEHSSKKIGYKLSHDETGNPLITESIATFVAPQISQGSYSYESTAAEVNVPIAYEDWRGGCGFVFAPQTSLAKLVYAYATGIDASWPNRLYVAPAKQTGGSTTQAPIKFVYSSFGTHVMTTRYIMEWTGAAWTTRLDNGGKTNQDLIEYKNSRNTYLVLVLSDDNYYISTDGITFTQPNAGGIYPTYRSSSSATSASTLYLTATIPTGMAVDDIMIAAMSHDNSSAIATPSGWTLISSWSSGTIRGGIYYKRVVANETTSVTWVMTGTASRCAAAIVAYQGCETSGAPYDAGTFATTFVGTTNATSGAESSLGANRTWLQVVTGTDGAGTGLSGTPAAGYTERADVSSSGPIAYFADKTNQSAGAIAATTVTLNNNATGLSIVMALKPLATSSALSTGMRLAVRGSANGEPVLWTVDSGNSIRGTQDPTAPGAWSAADTIQFGQPGTISGLEVLDNVFYLYTNKGITSYDGTTVSTVWNNSSLTLESDAARPFTWVDQRTYFTYGDALFRLDSGNSFVEKVWPHIRQREEDTRTGTITSITGDSKYLYFTIKNLAGNYVLMKCNPYVELTLDTDPLIPVFDINEFTSNACGAMLTVPAASDTFSATNPQLIYGYGTNGNYIILTRNGTLPSDDSNYRFDTATGTIIGAYNNAGARLFPKFLNSGVFIASNADANTTGVLTADTLSLTGTTVNTSIATGTTASGTISGNVTTDTQFTDIRYNLTMDSNTNTTPYQVRGIVFNTSLNPTRMRRWDITIDIAEELERIGGGDSSYGAHYLADHLFNGLTQRVTYYDRGGTAYVTRILDIKGVHVGRDKLVYQVVLVQLY